MFTVIVYDIQENRIRNRVSKTLERFGERVQKSVFECDLSDSQLQRLKLQLNQIKFSEDDNIRFYYMEMSSVKRIETIGSDNPCINQEFYVA
ncbi:MAG: CRISPR-associated endonuclease Cas2 [Candidatus Sericytochromatia bacterium]